MVLGWVVSSRLKEVTGSASDSVPVATLLLAVSKPGVPADCGLFMSGC